MGHQISLVHVPEPFLDESPASWLIRVCEYHQSWPNHLFRLFRLSNIRDIDLDLNPASLRKLCYGTKISSDQLKLLARKFATVRKGDHAEAFLLYKKKEKAAHYRFCPECLKKDRTPYWRLTWRMSHIQICVDHQCRLISHCRSCDVEIGPLMVQSKHLPDCATRGWCGHCQNCGASLAEAPVEKIYSSDVINMIGRLQQTITASLIHGFFRIDGLSDKLPLSHLPRALLAGATPKESNSLIRAQTLTKEIKEYLISPFSVSTITRSSFRNTNWLSNNASTKRVKAKLVKYGKSYSRLKIAMDLAMKLRISMHLD